MRKRVLLVDAMPLMYAIHAQFAHFSVQSGPYAGEKTGLKFGVLRTLRSWKNKFGCQKVVLAWDVNAPVLKAVGVTDYKSGRPSSESKERMREQLPAVKKLLLMTSFSQVEKEGYEADDILATIARQLELDDVESVISTVDRDLLSAVSEKVSVFLSGRKIMYAPQNVDQVYGIPACYIPHYKALMGDASDNIKGVCPTGWDMDVKLVLNAAATQSSIVDDNIVNAICTRKTGMAANAGMMAQYLEKLKMTSLCEVPELDIVKGGADEDALQTELVRLEMKSLVKDIKEFVS